MTGWAALDRLLDTDPRDCGCERARELIDIYADLFVTDRETARERYGDVAVHLSACGPCTEDFGGLLKAILAS